MVKFTVSLSLLVLASSIAIAMQPVSGQDSVKLILPHLDTNFKVYETPVAVLASSDGADTSTDSPLSEKKNIAAAYLKEKHSIPGNQVKFTNAYTDKATGITHVYAKQILGSVPIDNALANVNINAKNQVISSSQTFVANPTSPQRDEFLKQRTDKSASVISSFQSLAKYIKTPVDDKAMNKVTVASTSNLVDGATRFTLTGLPDHVAPKGSAIAYKMLLNQGSGKLVDTWHIVLEQPGHWWSANVDSKTGKVISINDWVSQATKENFYVYPRSVNTPDDGSRKWLTNPADKQASPKGWVYKDTTVGNNVWAQNNPSGGTRWQNNYRPAANNRTNFGYPIDFNQQPPSYLDAAITQLFYTINTMHDLSFLYGFDEAAGNFQEENYSGEGVGGDYVVGFAQDGSGLNNANFATPPDGQHGVMRMYIWTETDPNRDGDLEQDIVAHEFTHGISNRLTGGPSNSDCLYGGESGGMGEGWSDTVAYTLQFRPGDKRTRDIEMGVYAYGKGIRKYPYSTNMQTNPETYGYLNKPGYSEVHDIGEVWAVILYEVMWNLMGKHGIADDLFNHDLTYGNSLGLQLLLDGMKLQPCNPTFIDARNAILQADLNRSNGKNMCDMWKGFAKRGLGYKAYSSGNNYYEDYSLPSGC